MNMILIAHITIALASIIFAGITWLFPSNTKLWISYTFVGLTLATGTYLVFLQPANLPQVCTTGILYLLVVGAGILQAHRKLAAQHHE